MSAGTVSLVVINYGAPELVRRLLETLAPHEDARLVREVVVVDNGWPERGDSRQSLGAAEATFPLRFVRNPSASYASGVNAGAAAATGEILLICNNDLEWRPGDSLRPLIDVVRDLPRLGVAGPSQCYPDGRPQRSGGRLPGLGEALAYLVGMQAVVNPQTAARRRAMPVAIPYVDGACMATTRACFTALGGFDEGYDFYGEDLDYCWRAARAGWLVRYVPAARVVHARGATSLARDERAFSRRMARAKIRFVTRRSGVRVATLYAWIVSAGAAWRALAFAALGLVVPRFAAHRDSAWWWALAHHG
jgi:hypothetical protein